MRFLNLHLLLLLLTLPALIPPSLASLQSFTTCTSLLSHLRSAALTRVTAYGLSPRPHFFLRRRRPIPIAASVPSFAAAAASAPAAPVAGVDFSETNVQVPGVDEPDVLKTDGTRVYALRGTVFSVVNVHEGGAGGTVRGNLTLPLVGVEMLVGGGDALVIARDFDGSGKRVAGCFARGGARSISFLSFPCHFRPRAPVTVVYRISVKSAKPILLETLRLDGTYVSARAADGVARIVLRVDPTLNLPFVFPSTGVTPEEALVTNQQVVRASGVTEWLPGYRLTRASCGNAASCAEERGLIAGCGSVFVTDTFAGFHLLAVATVPLAGGSPRGGVAVTSDAGDVYATPDTLYVATTAYRYDFAADSPRFGARFETDIHKFALRAAGASYVASGSVSGSVLNQFSMHEFKGVFFVAATEGAPWWGGRDTSRSTLTSLKPRGRRLQRLSAVTNLGLGERIFAVRYIGDTAYVVTFRQVDPLYVVDLSNPDALRLRGELKIPGFSAYLHPLPGGRLLGVGREATPDGRTTGAKVSLFDVSDATRPAEVASWTLSGSYSAARWDHRAFLYWPSAKVAVLPLRVSSSNAAERFAGSVVLEVTDAGIVERGRISHPPCCGSSMAPVVERNFVLGRTHLWSLSRETLQINAIENLAVEDVVPLPREDIIVQRHSLPPVAVPVAVA